MMEHHFIVNLARILLFIEIFTIIVFVIVVYGFKIYQIFAHKDKEKLDREIQASIKKCFDNNSSPTKKDLKLFKSDLMLTLSIAEQNDKNPHGNWGSLKKVIVNDVFHAQLKKLSTSGKIYNRYYAANIANYCFEEKYSDIVIKLIHDPVLLVCVDAARVGFKFASPGVINAAIDAFSKFRRLQQSIYSSMAIHCGVDVEKIIVERMSIEKDPYIRAFCYRLLSQFKATMKITDIIKPDLDGNAIELRLSALNYAATNEHCKGMIAQYLNDEQWQMRSTAAKLLGVIKDYSAVPALGEKLSDKEWWVRIRAAEALSLLGEKGLDILRSQSPEKDKYAYEAASQVLISEKNTRSA